MAGGLRSFLRVCVMNAVIQTMFRFDCGKFMSRSVHSSCYVGAAKLINYLFSVSMLVETLLQVFFFLDEFGVCR